jgi:predicted transcriptional regulator
LNLQSTKLCTSLPNFEPIFRAADKRGSAKWFVVRWKGILPKDIRPEEVEVVEGPYPSRTAALEASYKLKLFGPRKRIIDTNLPWGVWQWPDEDGILQYQSIKPDIPITQNQPDQLALESKEAYASTSVRLSDKAYTALRRIADEDGKTLQAVLDDALQEYEKQRFFKNLNAAYQALHDDPQAWAAELKERALWDTTLMDGLDRDEIWHEDGTVTIRGTERESA